MNIVELIARKRDGAELAGEEIAGLVAGYAVGDVPDYQMAAWAMAVACRGMTAEETAALTEAMLRSGEVFSWPAGGPPKVDKHSSGGIGDKVSLILAPALAACGMAVPMISGRGLGATGGTLDKLEAIPGFRTGLSMDEARGVVDKVGCVICAASSQLAPADRKLYALRDVTGTVPSIPLITASIMSKKLAEGLDALVLDVKCGSGAFMKTTADALALAESLTATAARMGVACTALVTDMNQPLGRMCGNAVEVQESVACLAGAGPGDLRELTVELGAELFSLAGKGTLEEGRAALAGSLDDGTAMQKYREMVICQDGDPDAELPRAPETMVTAERAGTIARIDTEKLGWAIIGLGGGRQKLEDAIDPAVGLEMLVRIGDRVEAGQPIVGLFARKKDETGATAAVRRAITIADQTTSPPPLVIQRVTA
ncbi:Pyrimidine-nucleoside phosphorylase [Pirellulimonas nuda]|uniref:thymidine phosphorylase n=1 Tax=Pirellulimonas nuda TaxID=2528009 RepID=A0A518DEP7_9BACT|nr:thymidine phosphorylase [Pirellulimonas nuda]QDU89949.1 Pyrimidine-nucleoside phosphorylase [Pirellulimonas nuda]